MGLSTRGKIILVIVTIVSVIILGLLISHLRRTSYCVEYDFVPVSNKEAGLYLTSYIEKGELTEAKEKASGQWKGVESFSGYLTVNKTSDSNMFFWFFPVSSSYNDTDNAPVILCLQGGPGMSSMISLFFETGPFYVDSNNEFHKRLHFWGASHSMLYIDSPVSTGFSYSNDTENYPRDTDAVSSDLYEALLQFFTLFDDYAKRDFYIVGTSYCGKYIPILAHLIHKKNGDSEAVKINLRGLGIGGGYFDAEIQDKYADFNYYLGFIDKRQKELCEEQERKISRLIKSGNYEAARNETLYLKINLTSLVSGWDNFIDGNALQTEPPPDLWNFGKFLDTSCVKQSLNADPSRSYLPIGAISQTYSRRDYYRSTKPEMEALLQAKSYNILIFAGMFDMVVPHFGIADFLDLLKWDRDEEYAEAKRKVWMVNGTIAGWVREIPGFAFLLIRNAGHMPCRDNNFWCYHMISRFTSGRLLSGEDS